MNNSIVVEIDPQHTLLDILSVKGNKTDFILEIEKLPNYLNRKTKDFTKSPSWMSIHVKESLLNEASKHLTIVEELLPKTSQTYFLLYEIIHYLTQEEVVRPKKINSKKEKK